MCDYHQNTSLSLILTPLISQQQDSHFDGREIGALERTNRGFEAGAAPGLAGISADSLLHRVVPIDPAAPPFSVPPCRRTLRQHLGQNKVPAGKLRERRCLSPEDGLLLCHLLNHVPSPCCLLVSHLGNQA